MPHLQIRSAVGSDVSIITAIVQEAYEPYVERIGRKPAPMNDDYERLVGAGWVYVLLTDGQVGGLIVLRRETDHVLIGNVAVGRSFRGRGLGRRLLDHAETWARRSSVGELRLYTNEQMHENLALYRKLGWNEYGRTEKDGFKRVDMRKWIGLR